MEQSLGEQPLEVAQSHVATAGSANSAGCWKSSGFSSCFKSCGFSKSLQKQWVLQVAAKAEYLIGHEAGPAWDDRGPPGDQEILREMSAELCKLKRKLEALQVVAPAMSAGQLKTLRS